MIRALCGLAAVASFATVRTWGVLISGAEAQFYSAFYRGYVLQLLKQNILMRVRSFGVWYVSPIVLAPQEYNLFLPGLRQTET